MKFEEVMAAAQICRRYAAAVESKLYMGMSINEAHDRIEEATLIAELLEEFAEKLDTVSPADLG
jgi:hypothetical protein